MNDMKSRIETDKMILTSDGHIFNKETKKEYAQTPEKHGKYLVCCLPEHGIVYVHRIIAQYFLNGGNPIKEGYEIHHKDCNPKNNEISNLMIMKRKDHRDIHKLIRAINKADNHDSINIDDRLEKIEDHLDKLYDRIEHTDRDVNVIFEILGKNI